MVFSRRGRKVVGGCSVRGGRNLRAGKSEPPCGEVETSVRGGATPRAGTDLPSFGDKSCGGKLMKLMRGFDIIRLFFGTVDL